MFNIILSILAILLVLAFIKRAVKLSILIAIAYLAYMYFTNGLPL